MINIANLINTGKTVFTSEEMGLILGIENKHTLKNSIQRLSKSGILYHHPGNIRSLKTYDHMELASKLRKKSYISLETVLQSAGIIFQDYSHTITLVSDNSVSHEIEGKIYQFSKIKDTILANSLGIINTGKYMIASPERALCDRIYLTPQYYFDNLSNLNIGLLSKLSSIYNKRTALEINHLIDGIKSK
ncbi:MAG: hypothetical protein WC606_02620 [Candidatus Absconditabacterales bacterium]